MRFFATAGSVGDPDRRLTGYGAIICSEVIEHLYPDVLDKILPITLGIYQPHILIVTTPNAEYNVNFGELNYGKSNATMRHDDHKFEWTRQQFQDWYVLSNIICMNFLTISFVQV